MLADDITQDKELPLLYDGLDKVIEKIRHAQKFILTSEFCIAADGLVENIPELHKVVPMCRIPFPLTWIEFLHDDRPHWNPNGPHQARPVNPERHQGSPQRVGFLLEQLGDSKRWEAQLFWKLRDVPLDIIDTTPLNGSLLMVEFDCNASLNMPDPLFAAITPRPARFGLEFMMRMREEVPEIFKRLIEYGQEDWGGENRFLVAVLGLLNARNVVEMQRVDKRPENIKRRKKGKRELFSHSLVKVRPFIVAGGGTVTGGGHRDLRMHFVRGHFKHRTTGMFWWSMHARGEARHGMVVKDYELEGDDPEPH